MNYLKEILEFEKWIETNPLNPTAQLLYYKLLDINNKCNWMPWFTVSNTTLIAKMSVSGNTLAAARAKLVESGRIIYSSSGNRKKSGTYHIIPFCNSSNSNIEVEDDTNAETTSKSEVVSEITEVSNSGSTSNIETINKQNISNNRENEPEEETEEKEKDILGDNPNNINLNEVLDYYVKAAKKEWESPNDRSIALKIMKEPGMTIDYIKEGIDESYPNYKPIVEGQRMPFSYCRPAIIRRLKAAERGKTGVKLNQPRSNIPQNNNFTQREYDKNYFDSLYEDV